jgi:hypothetical protein
MHVTPESEQMFRTSRVAAWILTAGLLLFLIVPGTAQTIGAPAAELQRFRGLFSNMPRHVTLARFARDLASSSRIGTATRRAYRSATVTSIRQGSHDVVVGDSGALFYREDVGLVTSAHFPLVHRPEKHPSVPVLADFAAKLAARGVHLIVLPVPVATSLYPARLWPSYASPAGTAEVSGYATWLGALRDRGVDVIDLIPTFSAQRGGQEPLYSLRNTHWLPRGIDLAADVTAKRIRPFISAGATMQFDERNESVQVFSDLLGMLDLPDDGTRFPKERTSSDIVLDGSQPYLSRPGGPVLLMGDSFSGVFSGERAQDEPKGAGFTAHLSAALGTTVEAVVRPGASPADLRKELSTRPELLREKQVVIWEFCVRSLLIDDWHPMPLPPL